MALQVALSIICFLVAAAAGFNPDEARNVFRQIRMYDTECIGLEEFNDWWNSNQRKEVRLG